MFTRLLAETISSGYEYTHSTHWLFISFERKIRKLCVLHSHCHWSAFLKSRATRLYSPLCRSVGWSVGPFLLFRRFWAFWAYCSCPDALLSFSSTAPAHLHATRVAVYPALFDYILVTLWPCVWSWVHYYMVSVGWSVSMFLLPISKITIYSLRLRWLLCLKWRIDK